MNRTWLSNLTLIRSLHVGKLLVDRGRPSLFSGIGQFECSYADKAGGFQIYFFFLAKRGSAEKEKKKRRLGAGELCSGWNRKETKGKSMARGHWEWDKELIVEYILDEDYVIYLLFFPLFSCSLPCALRSSCYEHLYSCLTPAAA